MDFTPPRYFFIAKGVVTDLIKTLCKGQFWYILGVFQFIHPQSANWDDGSAGAAFSNALNNTFSKRYRDNRKESISIIKFSTCQAPPL